MGYRRAGRAAWTTAFAALLAAGCAAVTVVPRDCPERFAGWAPGPEDIELDRDSPGGPRLIVSAQERRVQNRDGSLQYQGQLLSVPLAGPQRGQARAFTLEGRDPAPFHPQGIFLLRTASPRLLYVINHAGRDDHRIEIFTVDGDRLVAQPSPPPTALLPNPNDLIALPGGEVYVTNMTKYRSRALQMLEALLRLRSGSVVHYKPGAPGPDHGWTIVARDIAYANGIAVAADERRVFVAAALGEGIHVFGRDPGSGSLTPEPERLIRMGTGVDNLSWTEDGKRLIAARHPASIAFLRHRRTPDVPSPSEIWQVQVDEARTAEPLYGNDGAQISAASVGVVSGGWLYIGQVFNQGVLGCRL